MYPQQLKSMGLRKGCSYHNIKKIQLHRVGGKGECDHNHDSETLISKGGSGKNTLNWTVGQDTHFAILLIITWLITTELAYNTIHLLMSIY